MSDYTLLKPLVVNGKEQPPGATVKLTDALAHWLRGLGVVGKAGEQPAEVAPPQPVPALLAKPAPRKRGCKGCGW